MVRRVLVGAGALAILSACSPAQTVAWWNWHDREPQEAADWAAYECGELCTNDTNRNGVVEPDIGSAPAPSESSSGGGSSSGHGATGYGSGDCGQWFGTAMDAGWSESDWPTVSRIMYAESRCDPGAYNGASGVTGLMQIMPFWANDCGGSPDDLYNAWFNLHCALHVKAVQGWSAWVTY